MDTYKEKMQFELPQTVAALNDLDAFMRKLGEKLHHEKLKDGEDITALIKAADIKIPGFLKDTPITYSDNNNHKHEGNNSKKIILAGKPEKDIHPVEKRIFCVHFGKRIEVCLDCGWLYCMIIIIITY